MLNQIHVISNPPSVDRKPNTSGVIMITNDNMSLFVYVNALHYLFEWV